MDNWDHYNSNSHLRKRWKGVSYIRWFITSGKLCESHCRENISHNYEETDINEKDA